MWEGKTKPEGHIADFLHIGDLLNREMYEDSRYRDLPGLQQPKALKNPHRRGAYDVFRLIMPDYDTDRVFGIREAFLVELLCLAYPTSTQGQKAQLRAWKQKEKNISAGHLTKVAYEVSSSIMIRLETSQCGHVLCTAYLGI